MSVTISLVQPKVELVFAEGSASIVSLIDADTVRGVTPGTTGLAVLATNTAAEAISIIGAIDRFEAFSSARAAAQAALSVEVLRVNILLDNYATKYEASTAGAAAVQAHAKSMAAHPDRPTLDQAIQFTLFFGN